MNLLRSYGWSRTVPDRRFWQKMRILPRFCALMRDLSTILLQMKRESKKSRRINLDTGENQEAPPYRFRAGNENFWFSTSLEDGIWYCSEPGYKNIRSMSGVNGLRLGALDHKLYYMVQGRILYIQPVPLMLRPVRQRYC